MKRPRRIVTGPFTWAVSWVKPDRHDVAGETDALNLAIRVMPGNALDFERETLMHELLHACCSVAGLDLGDDGEERVVAGLSPFLLDALRRSPGLAAYLFGGDRG